MWKACIVAIPHSNSQLPEKSLWGRSSRLTMASPELAIAKAALSASLFRADPVSLSRPSVDAFFQQLSTTIIQCSRPNVQVWPIRP